jgi:hypothetical protein
MVSSWKLDTSTTNQRGAREAHIADRAVPMLPASAVSLPSRRSISAVQVETVDLPLVPVTAT